MAEPGRGRRSLALILALLLLLCLPACSRDEQLAGRWRCVGAEVRGLSLESEDLGDDPALLFLEPDGRGSISSSGREGALSWTRSGDAIDMEIGGRTYTASLRGDEIVLSLDDGVTLRFRREDAPDPEPTPTVQERAWYGWWRVESSRGKMPESWYDCCAALEQDRDGPVLLIWDEDSSRREPLSRIWLEPDTDRDLRNARSLRGWFLLQELGEGDWTVDLDAPQLVFSGHYERGSESFDYSIYLRPWGDRWEDSTEHLPFHWRDWYLPQIEAGAPMPDTIG